MFRKHSIVGVLQHLRWNAGKIFLALLGLMSLPALIKASGYHQEDLVTPCDIQGGDFVSDYIGQNVRTRGVVFADMDDTSKRGFFIQEENCDGDPLTSDGIFVYLNNRTDVVSLGDRIEVAGMVQEYYGMTEVNSSPDLVSVLSHGDKLPEPIELNPPLDNDLSKQYFESLEAMYVGMADARVVGPTSARDETWVVNAELGIGRVYQDHLAGTGEVACVDDGGFFEIKPEASVGDRIRNLLGVLEYSYGIYRLQLLQQPELISGTRNFTPSDFSCGPSVTTFNLENLFDPVDDPDKKDPLPSGAEYLRHLNKIASAVHNGLGEPSLIAVQEVENTTVLQDLVVQQQLEADYDFVLEEGPDERGIDVALLYRPDRLQVLSSEQRQGCTTLKDGLGPDGNGVVTNPQNMITCDTDADGFLDGNRLFSRPPLIIHVDVYSSSCSDATDIWLIVNHWKSKSEDTEDVQYTLPRRIDQAEFVVSLYQEITGANPDAMVMVLGDLNDYPTSEPLKVLKSAGLLDLSAITSPLEHYTYIYHGISQVIDHILVNPALKELFIASKAVHFNADYAEEYSRLESSFIRSSDHDPVIAWFGYLDGALFLPLIRR